MRVWGGCLDLCLLKCCHVSYLLCIFTNPIQNYTKHFLFPVKKKQSFSNKTTKVFLDNKSNSKWDSNETSMGYHLRKGDVHWCLPLTKWWSSPSQSLSFFLSLCKNIMTSANRRVISSLLVGAKADRLPRHSIFICTSYNFLSTSIGPVFLSNPHESISPFNKKTFPSSLTQSNNVFSTAVEPAMSMKKCCIPNLNLSIEQLKSLRYLWFKDILEECNNYEVALQHIRQVVNEVSKENLKPRKRDQHKLQFIQCNMQKSQYDQIDLNHRISRMNKAQECIICCKLCLTIGRTRIVIYYAALLRNLRLISVKYNKDNDANGSSVYRNLSICTYGTWTFNHWEALLRYLRLIVNKTSKENLKPRKKITTNVKFLQCNMQKSQHAQIDLNRRISNMNKGKDHFICCIQEPSSTRSKLISQPNTVQRFGKSICPRTCIYTDMNTNAWFLEVLSTKDITAIQVCIQKQQVLVVSAYLDSADSTVWSREMDNVVEYADGKNLGLIICTDSNCHSTLFGPDTNTRGKKFEEAVAGHNLVVENIGHVPTFHGGKARTCIDVTLTKRLHSAVLGWRVNTDYNGSDHNTIEFNVQQDMMTIPKVWMWHKADWPAFKESMEKVTYELPRNITVRRANPE